MLQNRKTHCMFNWKKTKGCEQECFRENLTHSLGASWPGMTGKQQNTCVHWRCLNHRIRLSDVNRRWHRLISPPALHLPALHICFSATQSTFFYKSLAKIKLEKEKAKKGMTHINNCFLLTRKQRAAGMERFIRAGTKTRAAEYISMTTSCRCCITGNF